MSAVAVATPWSDAVGTVGLRCLPDRLQVDLLRVGRFRAGFALLSAASPVTFEVPYTAVRGLVRSAGVLVLSLDPRSARPYHRFALCRFSLDPHESLLGGLRWTAGVRLLRTLVPAALGLAAFAWLPDGWVDSAPGRAAVASLLAWIGFGLLGPIARFLVEGGPRSRVIGARFEQALCERLGLQPAEGLTPRGAAPAEGSSGAALPGEPLPAPRAADSGDGAPWRMVGRPRALALASVGALVTALAAVLAVQKLGVVESVVLPVDEGRAGMTEVVDRRSREGSAAVAPRHVACRCDRASSALWNGGLPVLSILVAPRRGEIEPFWIEPGQTVAIAHPNIEARRAARQKAEEEEPEGDRRRRRKRKQSSLPAPEVELDIAVVNNSAHAIDHVSLVVTFAQRTSRDTRTAIMERGLAWPRPLRPAEAVKWRIEAEGTELRVDCRIQGTLGEHPPASASDLRGLLDARLSPVRVHGAMMLAYVGDPGALAAARSLGPLTAREEIVRGEIVRTLEPLRACLPSPTDAGSALCVHNGTGELLRGVRITPAGLGRDAPGQGWSVTDLFRPGVSLQVERPNYATPGGFSVAPLGRDGATSDATEPPGEP